MTTPIEVAALAVDSLPWDGECGGVDPDNDEIARAVFESIDRDGSTPTLYRSRRRAERVARREQKRRDRFAANEYREAEEEHDDKA